MHQPIQAVLASLPNYGRCHLAPSVRKTIHKRGQFSVNIRFVRAEDGVIGIGRRTMWAAGMPFSNPSACSTRRLPLLCWWLSHNLVHVRAARQRLQGPMPTLCEDELRANGWSVIGPFTTLEDARQAAAREAIDLALLDVNLRGEMAFPLANELTTRGIPYIFLSGYAASMLPEAYRGAPRLVASLQVV
jgi:hypothetical protein